MQTPDSDILDFFATKEDPPARRDMLPWWIRVFIWIFFISSALVIVSFVFAPLGVQFHLELYGVNAFDPWSLKALLLMALFLLKGLTAFGLWAEKDWAINIGIVDASLGIAICFGVMLYIFDNHGGFSFRLELLLLIPFLLKLVSIREAWKNAVSRVS